MKNIKKALLTILLLTVFLIPARLVSADGNSVIDIDTGYTVTEMETKEYDLNNSSDSSSSSYKFYELDMAAGVDVIVPIKIDVAGKLAAGAHLRTEMAGVTLQTDLYADQACTDQLYSTGKYFVIEKSGTYYFKFRVTDTNATMQPSYKVDFGSFILSAEDKDLTNNKIIASAFLDYQDPIYYKITVTKPGVIDFYIKSEYSQNVTLCNSSKKAISDESYSSDVSSDFYFGVAKGTYYIKVATASTYGYVGYSFTSIKDGGATKKTASKVAINSDNGKTGLLYAADKTSKIDWYKFYNPKKQQISVDVAASIASGEIEVQVVDAKGAEYVTFFLSPSDSEKSYTIYYGNEFDTVKTLPKGTYYIKIKKSTKKTTAGYSVYVDAK
jgi:hypothetical protein